MLVSFDLHVHTSISYDGFIPPDRIAKYAIRQRLDGIAVTDHDTIEGGLQVKEAAKSEDLIIVVGAEIKTNLGDMIGLFLRQEIQSRKFEDVIKEIHSQGGVVVLPHPFKYHPHSVFEFLHLVDTVELYNGRTRNYTKSLFEHIGSGNVCLTGGSDAHLSWEIGSVRTVIRVAERTEEAVKEAIKSGHSYPVVSSYSPWYSTIAIIASKIKKRMNNYKRSS